MNSERAAMTPVETLAADEVAVRLQKRLGSNRGKYLAMFSSFLGGIVLEQLQELEYERRVLLELGQGHRPREARAAALARQAAHGGVLTDCDRLQRSGDPAVIPLCRLI